MNIPNPVHLRAISEGETATNWLTQLAGIVHHLEKRWHLVTSQPLDGGSESIVLPAQRSDGSQAILKIGMPGVSNIPNEAAILRLADGRGYVKLFNVDREHNAMLIERLGTPLAHAGKPLTQQIEIICQTLQTAWRPLDNPHGLMAGAEKARWLAAFIDKLWHELDAPCSKATKDQAIAYAEARESAHDPANCVLVHGDAHALNTLQARAPNDDSPLYKFVDPDGLFAEPACDLAVPMRGFSEELLRGDAVQLGLARCEQLAALTGVDQTAIWQWGFMERVSTGLLLWKIGRRDLGVDMLHVADLWGRAPHF